MMPIKKDIFEKIRRKQSLVLEYLYAKQNEAYSADEIIKGIGLDGHIKEIFSELKFLVDSGYVSEVRATDDWYYMITQKGIDKIEREKG